MTDHDAHNDPDAESPGAGRAGQTAREAAWDDVAAHFSNLGKKFRQHFEQAPRSSTSQEPGSDPEEPWSDAGLGGPTSSGTTTSPPGTGDPTSARPSEPSSARGRDSVRRWIDNVDETFTKLGDTVRDPEFRRDAGSSVNRLGVALGTTLREFGEQLQDKFGSRPGQPESGERMPEVPAPPTPAPPTPGASGPADPPPAAPGRPAGGTPPPVPDGPGPVPTTPTPPPVPGDQPPVPGQPTPPPVPGEPTPGRPVQPDEPLVPDGPGEPPVPDHSLPPADLAPAEDAPAGEPVTPPTAGDSEPEQPSVDERPPSS